MEYKESIQVVDPRVTKSKFEEEIRKFKNVEGRYQKKGIICTKIDYPNVYFIFAITKLKPPVIAYSVRVNFINYDFEPPSIVFIDPFTEEVLKREQVPIRFIQVNKNTPLQPIDLLQGSGNMIPFFCIPGVREYHAHAAHSGDSWFLYRTKGEGSLLFIIDQLYNYSIGIAKAYQVVINLADLKLNIHQEIKIKQNE